MMGFVSEKVKNIAEKWKKWWLTGIYMCPKTHLWLAAALHTNMIDFFHVLYALSSSVSDLQKKNTVLESGIYSFYIQLLTPCRRPVFS